MGIALQQEVLRTESVAGEGARSTQIEGRLSLPAGLPPMVQLQFSRARVREVKAFTGNGIIAINGCLDIEAVYTAAPMDENIRCEYRAAWTKDNDTAVLFSQEIPMAEAYEGMAAEAAAVVTGMSADMVDEAGVHVRIDLELTARVITAVEVSVATGTAGEGIEAIHEPLSLENNAGKAETETAVNMVLALPEIKPDFIRIIAQSVRIGPLHMEIIRGRVMVEGRLELSAIYVARYDDGTQGLETAEWGGEGRTALAFETFLDLPGLDSETLLEPIADLGRIDLEVIGPREIKLDAGVKLAVKAYRPLGTSVITDLTAGADEIVDAQRTQITCAHLVERAEENLTVEATLEIPPVKPGADRILQYQLTPHSLGVQTAEGKCLIEGWVDFNLIYLNSGSDGTESTLTAMDWGKSQGTGIILTEVLETPQATPGLAADLSWRLEHVEVEQITQRLLKVRATIRVKVRVTEERILPAITEAALVPLAPIPGRPSLLFCVIQPGDTLWNIARRYETTVEALVRVNKIADSEVPAAGTKILIPRSPVAV